MGRIIYWAIIRVAILIPTLWLLLDWMEYKFWWTLGIISIYGVIIHPAVVQYRLFLDENKEVLEDTICAGCKNFDETAVLCLIHDEHPTKDYIPCDGIDWEPKNA